MVMPLLKGKDKSELGIKAVSDTELEITLEKATPYFDYLLAFPSFFPQRQDIVEKYGKNYDQTAKVLSTMGHSS